MHWPIPWRPLLPQRLWYLFRSTHFISEWTQGVTFFSPCWLFAIIGRQNFSPSFRYFLQNKEFQNFGPFFRFSFGSHFGSVPRVDWFGETENWFFSGENATNNQFWSVGKPKFIWREREAAASAAAALNCKQLESRKTEKKFRGLILLISFEKMIVYFFVLFEQTSEKTFRCFVAKIIFLEKKLVRSRPAFLSPCSIIRPLARVFPKKDSRRSFFVHGAETYF